MLYMVFIYLFVMFLFGNKMESKMKNVFLVLPLLIIIWTRYGIGVDYFSYQDMYSKIDPQNLSAVFTTYKDLEIGYKLLMVPFRMLGVPYSIFLGMLNTTVTIFFFKWIKDNSSNTGLSVLMFYSMFFFVWVLSAMRQSIVLSISLYYLFNKNKSLSLMNSIALILLLSLFHKSTYFLLIYIFAKNIKWTKKKHLILIIFSIVFTFFPFDQLLKYIEFIPVISKVLNNYVDNAFNFYDFPGTIRLLIFFGVLFFYDKIPNKRKETDTLLFGTSLYFIFKFSELTASRGTIYSFFMILIIVPEITDYLRKYDWSIMQNTITVAIFIGSSLYFTKEFNSMFNLAQYLEPKTVMTYPNIFNKNIRSFGSLYSYEVNLYENVHEEYKTYLSLYNYKEKDYDENQSYQPISISGKYQLIGQDGTFITDLESDYYFSVIEGILVKTYYRDSYFYPSKSFTDLTDGNRTKEEMENIIIKDSLIHNAGYEEERLSFRYSDLPLVLKAYFPNEDAINEIYANKIYDSSGMIVVRIVYHKKVSYMYLTSNNEPILDFPTKQLRSYNEYSFLNIDVYGKTISINQSGEIIFWR